MLVIATHGGCAKTVRESALKADSGRSIPCRTGDSNPRQYCVWIFDPTLPPLSYPAQRKEGRFLKNKKNNAQSTMTFVSLSSLALEVQIAAITRSTGLENYS